MLDKFKDIFFIEDGHRYINMKTKKQLISVTTLIKRYQSMFDEDHWSNYKAEEYGVSQEEILYNWYIRKEVGLYLGSLIHNYIENYQYRKLISFKTPSSLSNSLSSSQLLLLEQYKKNLRRQAEDFINNYSHYNLIQPELVVGNEIVAGQIDYPTTDCIIDFKNDLQIDFSNKYQNMKYPIHYIQDCNYNKYALQLSMYKYLLEEKGVILPEANRIIKFDRFSDKYKCIEVPYLKNECKLMLDDYKSSSLNT